MKTKEFFFFIVLLFRIGLTHGQQVSVVDSVVRFHEDSSKYFVQPININSTASDFCPIFMDGKMVFVSGRDNAYGIVFSNKVSSEFFDLFISEKIDSVTFKNPKLFSKTINSSFNDGPATINKQQDLIVYTGNAKSKFNYVDGDTAFRTLQLFSSKKINGNWSSPVTLNFCDPKFTYCHPCLSPDGKTIWFSSNTTGGFGGMDLYFSQFENDNWSTPINLGPTINSTANEIFPSVSVQNILYFSSDKKNGYGGLDIYSFDMNDFSNSKCHLLEMPINSIKDDFGVAMDSSGYSGYFSSMRNENGKDDIYFFCNKYSYFDNCIPFVKPSNCFTFFEESTLPSDDTLGLIYEWDLGDGTKIKGLEAPHCFSKPGNYSIELNIIQKASGALFYNEVSYDFTVEDSAQLYINADDTINLGKAAILNCFKSKIPGYSISNYYWSFGDGFYSSGMSGIHDYKKTGEFIINLGVLAKNDTTGVLQKFCTEKKITVMNGSWINSTNNNFPSPTSKDFQYPVGEIDSLNFRVHLGSSKLEIPLESQLFSGLSDIKEFKDDSLFRYTTGSSKTILGILPNYDLAKMHGFSDAVVVGFNGDSLLPNQEKSLKGQLPDSLLVPENKTVVLRNVYFGFNKYEVETNYYSMLDSINSILKKNPEYSLSLFASADSVGNKNYNYQLSNKRANSIKKYFIAAGVKSSRIRIVPIGEESPLTLDQVDLKSNRRVSIYILKK